jgi:putative sigma-54 modulation protein
MLKDHIVSVQVVITREKSRHHVDMTLHARGEHFLHGAATGRDLAAALGEAAEKLEHQVQKLKSRWTETKRQGVSAGRVSPRAPAPAAVAGGSDGEVRIIRTRRYAVKPMSVDEAALEVGAGNGAFLVFRNASTDTVNVLFRRPDGNLGLIEPEA